MIEGHECWTPKSIKIEIDGVKHELMEYIGKGCLKEGDELFLPSEYDIKGKGREKLARMLKIAASEAGFTLVVAKWNKGEGCMYLKCQRHRPYNPNTKKKMDAEEKEETESNSKKKKKKKWKKKKQEITAVRPVNPDHKCTFCLPVQWDWEAQCFKIVGGHGTRSHCYHLPKDPVEVRRGLAAMDEEIKQQNIDMYRSGANSRFVRNYNREKHGEVISDTTLDYLRRTANKLDDKAVAVSLGDDGNVDDKNLSDADKLLRLLKATPGVSYHAIYSVAGSSLMTSNRRDYKATKRRLQAASQQAGEAEKDGDVFDFADIEGSHDFETYEKNQREAMKVGDGE